MSDIRVLLDTNIFISREAEQVIPEDLQQLLKTLGTLNVQVLLHPSSIEDLKRDKETARRRVQLSKLDAYAHLASPPSCDTDIAFLAVVGKTTRPNDKVDNDLLYAISRNAADLLVTEDKGIIKKASWLGLSDRVLGILDARVLFGEMLPHEIVDATPLIIHCPVHNLDINDPFFDARQIPRNS